MSPTELTRSVWGQGMTATPRCVPPTCVCVTYISFIPVQTSRSSCVVGERQKKKKRNTPCSKTDDVSGLWNVITPNSSRQSSAINHHGIGEAVKNVWLTDTLCKICSISSLHVKKYPTGKCQQVSWNPLLFWLVLTHQRFIPDSHYTKTNTECVCV